MRPLKLVLISAFAIVVIFARVETGTTTTAMTGSTAVAGFEASPQLSAGSQTLTQAATTQTQGQTVAGVQNLPSTDTSQDTSPLMLLGAALIAAGGALLRRPTEQPPV